MKYGRVDAMHKSFRDYFRAHGCEWQDTSSVGKGFPDALVGAGFVMGDSPIIIGAQCFGFTRYVHGRSGRIALLEIKSGPKARTKKDTAKPQADFAARFPVWRVANLDDADELIRWLKS